MEACEDVAQAELIAGGGFGEDHAAGAATGARADAGSFEDGYGFFGREQAQPRCGREAGEPTADYSEVGVGGEFMARWGEVDFPGRGAPAGVLKVHS